MIFRNHHEKEISSEEILNQASKCKREDLRTLLDHVQAQIEKSEDKDRNLLIAKAMITSRLASIRSQY